jgi:hypothetical protein
MSVRDSYLELSRYACSSQQFPITHSGLLRRRIHLDVVMFRATTVDHANLVSETLPLLARHHLSDLGRISDDGLSFHLPRTTVSAVIAV